MNVVSVILVVWVFITADRQDDGALARLVLFGGMVVTLLLFIFTILQRAQTDTFTSLNQTGLVADMDHSEHWGWVHWFCVRLSRKKITELPHLENGDHWAIHDFTGDETNRIFFGRTDWRI
ncbi:MAG UNVERIFIED_CONTAM: hypothetical protein LVT10_10930 [Anaerolineae bacterium]